MLCDQIEVDETGYAACMEKPERTGSVARLGAGVDERIISEGMTCEGVGWIGQPDKGQVAISYNHVNESSGSIKYENFLQSWVTYLLNNITRLLSNQLPKRQYNPYSFGLLLSDEEQ
jgi:hypothetical protein